ncbi:MAG: AraC family transcriptional regulator [Fibrella sp.]|nr:AraC family transcriptional regulator [Armatimonadota bacterium]
MEATPTKESHVVSEPSADFAPSRFENGAAMVLAGVTQHYTYDSMGAIPAQWQQFGPRIGTVPERTGTADYGVVVSTPGQPDFDYLTVFEVSDTTGLPADFTTMEIPAQRYAVFPHTGHVSTVCETIDAIFRKWLPKSGFEVTGKPDLLERYGENFNPATGAGDIEIWVPIKG